MHLGYISQVKTNLPFIAIAPSFVAGTVDNAPPKDPIGVRAAPTIHTVACSKAAVEFIF